MSDLVSRLLEEIQAKEQKARATPEHLRVENWTHPGPWVMHGIESRSEDEVALVRMTGRQGEALAEFIADNDPSAVLRRCEQDRWLVDWYVGWQETFRGPIPEGHSEEGALHFRMASEFVFNRLLASYGIDWADVGGITEEET